MSFADRLVLWLHIAFAVFAIGPLTIAVLTTPRYIRKRDVTVLRYQFRTTLIYSIVSLGVLVAGLILAQQLHDFSKWWLSVSMTLFIVALVLLGLVLHDQHRAITALEDAADEDAQDVEAPVAAEASVASVPLGSPRAAVAAELAAADDEERVMRLAHVERGRIASLGGIVALIWLVILILMVWR